MPKRSNHFQELVTMIERALAPHGAKITESKMFPVQGDEDDGEGAREIDVFIESNLGPFAMTIAVEAKDEGRRMTIERFEAIVGKYRGKSGVVVNKVVVVSRSGFSKTVVSRAEREGIEILTLENAAVHDWASKVPQQLDFEHAPHLERIDIHPKPDKAFSKEEWNRGRLYCLTCEKDCGSPGTYGKTLLDDADFVHSVRAAASRNGRDIHATVARPFTHKTVFRIDEVDYPVERLDYQFHANRVRTQFSVSAYQLGEQQVHHMSAKSVGTKVDFVVPNGHESERIVVKVGRDADVAATAPSRPPLQAPPQQEVSAAAVALSDQLRNDFANLNVKVDCGVALHDFCAGDDFFVDILLRIYIAKKKIRTATGIVVLGGKNAPSNEVIESWKKRAIASELDRVILVHDGDAPASTDMKLMDRVVVVAQAALATADRVRLMSPYLMVFYASKMGGEITLYGAKSDSPLATMDGAVIRHRNHQLSVSEFCGKVGRRVEAHLAGHSVLREPPHTSFGDREFRFEFQLPRSTLLILPDQSSVALARVAGNVVYRSGFYPVGQAKAQDMPDGTRSLRFDPAIPFYGSVLVASSGKPDRVETAGDSYRDPILLSQPLVRLPSALFENLFGKDADPLTFGNHPHKVARLRLDDRDPKWGLNLLPPSVFDRFMRAKRNESGE